MTAILVTLIVLLWIVPAQATTLFSCGFENGASLTESDCFTSGNACGPSGTCTVITSPVHSGTHAAQLTGPNNSPTFYFQSFTAVSGATFFSGWLYLPTGQPHSVTLDSANLLSSDDCTVGLETDASGNPSLYLEQTVGTIIGSPGTLTTGAYHCIDLEETPGTSANGTCELRIDRVSIAKSTTLTTAAATNADITMKEFANTAGTWTGLVTTNWDDFLVTNAGGATYGCALPASQTATNNIIMP